MENFNMPQKQKSNTHWGGIILLVIGSLFLFKNLDVYLFDWIFSWSTILLALGLIIGFKSNFTGKTWLILTIIGGVFTVKNIITEFYYVESVFTPIALILIGLVLLFKKDQNKFINNFGGDLNDPNQTQDTADIKSEDIVNSTNIFGGSNQKLFTKNLKGGEITAIFGGGDVDLTQTDFENDIVINVTAICGGFKLLVPPTWEVKNEVSAIFGGIDDKRSLIQNISDFPRKRLILKGTVLFGGLDIRNY
ncbi:LiaF transmembrane domain-containing protein [Pedobacter flavus]|uniref:LiaF domain-containing protein n=1 Tax=Pedobacter flavus TaxID=3113906 RepID=A0ABU7H380_9SPHI|nr:LiaF domain-containing protein [Pedobacter sp. VNH31]MEE1885458.1 LiaF domain-containing protein [Pedobacter sp. VNH31]